jgi:DNA-binding beta-propeller fold protein YncE
VYVVDAFRHDVSVYSPDGIFLRSWVPGNDPNFAWAPVALAFDQEGNLYFADQMQPRQQVLVFDPLGNLKLKFGYFGIGTGMFNFPSDIAVDDLGNIYVSDSQNFRVQVFDAQGNFLRVVATSFGLPTGVGIDRPGRLHVVDSLANEVLVIDVSDAHGVVFKYGSLGLEGEQFFYPRGIALDLSGKIYVADYSGNRVQIWSF